MKPVVIAIDGPAGSGKSTTARRVAEQLGFLYLDTGAMYRALTAKAIASGIDPEDEAAIGELARTIQMEMGGERGVPRVIVDGRDVTAMLRSPEISRRVSYVARVPEARRRLVAIQRAIAQQRDIVIEGRDIGTVVFPDATVKIYLDASLDERVRRRLLDLERQGERVDPEELRREIALRDEIDSDRSDSPLRRAEGAAVLDTTGLTIEEQVGKVVDLVRQAVRRPGKAGPEGRRPA
ncbi:MAG TPA: (d)CMP kinase [bacterium]|nr:(d)CMP kinase [bacterium]